MLSFSLIIVIRQVQIDLGMRSLDPVAYMSQHELTDCDIYFRALLQYYNINFN